FVAFALSESRAGSDARRIETRIVDDGRHLEVSGVKRFVTNGAAAQHIVVFGRYISGGAERGHAAVVIDRDTPGLEVSPKNDLFGMRGVPTTTVFLRSVRVPRRALLGEPGAGLELAKRTLARSRPLVGAQAVGLGRAALDLSVRYCRKRAAFGRPMTDL